MVMIRLRTSANEVCGVITSVDQCALRARSTNGVHHAIVEVNIVIGVVLGELHVCYACSHSTCCFVMKLQFVAHLFSSLLL